MAVRVYGVHDGMTSEAFRFRFSSLVKVPKIFFKNSGFTHYVNSF